MQFLLRQATKTPYQEEDSSVGGVAPEDVFHTRQGVVLRDCRSTYVDVALLSFINVNNIQIENRLGKSIR